MKLYNMWSFVVDSSVFDGFLRNIYSTLIYVSLMANEAYFPGGSVVKNLPAM